MTSEITGAASVSCRLIGNPFPVVQDGRPAGQPHINQVTAILKDKLAAVKRRFPDLSDVEQLQAAVSRYNSGAGLAPPNSDTEQPVATI